MSTMRVSLGDGRVMSLPAPGNGRVAKGAQPTRAEVLAYVRSEARKAAKAAAKALAAEEAKARRKAVKKAAKSAPVRKGAQASSDLAEIGAELARTRTAIALLDAQRAFDAARTPIAKSEAGQRLTLAKLRARAEGTL